MRVIFVCHGNICRSTMAESYMNHIVREAGLEGEIQVESRATSREEIGNPPHPGTVRELKKHGIPMTPHRATRMDEKDYEAADLVVYMDANNKRNLLRMFADDPDKKMRPLLGRDVADPWYTGNYADTYEDVSRGCDALLGEIRARL
jgi:protein-tyrosine phosphatase